MLVKHLTLLCTLNRRMWRLQSLLCGNDPTWGIAKEMGRLLNVSPLELEDPDIARLEPNSAAV